MKRLPNLEEFTRMLASHDDEDRRRLVAATEVMMHINRMTEALTPIMEKADVSPAEVVHDFLVMANTFAILNGLSIEDSLAIAAAAEDAAETIVGVGTVFGSK